MKCPAKMDSLDNLKRIEFIECLSWLIHVWSLWNDWSIDSSVAEHNFRPFLGASFFLKTAFHILLSNVTQHPCYFRMSVLADSLVHRSYNNIDVYVYNRCTSWPNSDQMFDRIWYISPKSWKRELVERCELKNSETWISRVFTAISRIKRKAVLTLLQQEDGPTASDDFKALLTSTRFSTQYHQPSFQWKRTKAAQFW